MKITTWNLENFFLLMDKYNGQDLNQISNEEWENLSLSLTQKNKNIEKVFEIANIIKEIDSDIYILSEIGGEESLLNFNKYFLNNQYNVFIKKSNSKRGIDIGFLIKKNYQAKLKDNLKLKLDNKKRFSRNIAELRIYQDNKLYLIILGIHLKSKRSSKEDFEGMTQRSMELKGLKNHINQLHEEKKVPIIIGGDFNCSIDEEDLSEFSKDLNEFHRIKKSTIKESFSFINMIKKQKIQLDYIFSTRDIEYKLDQSFNYRFKNEYGYIIDEPKNLYEKKLLPSDHYPVILKIKSPSEYKE